MKGLSGQYFPGENPKAVTNQGILVKNQTEGSYQKFFDDHFHYYSFLRNASDMLPSIPGWGKRDSLLPPYRLIPAGAKDGTDAVVSCGNAHTADDPVDGLRIQVATYNSQSKAWEWHGSSNGVFAPYLPSLPFSDVVCKFSTTGTVEADDLDAHNRMHAMSDPLWVIPVDASNASVSSTLGSSHKSVGAAHKKVFGRAKLVQ